MKEREKEEGEKEGERRKEGRGKYYSVIQYQYMTYY